MKTLHITLFFLFIILNGCNSSILDDPTTSIHYSVAERSHVKLTIENSYKTLIATLVDEEQFAGTYQVSFIMSDLAEGVYFYTIELKGTDSDYYYKVTKPMILVK